jgi:hypothetical protein
MKERALQTSSTTHPEEPAEARTLNWDEIITNPGPEGQAGYSRHHSRAAWIDSSAGLESVAHVENTVEDVYYRNDSICGRCQYDQWFGKGRGGFAYGVKSTSFPREERREGEIYTKPGALIAGLPASLGTPAAREMTRCT